MCRSFAGALRSSAAVIELKRKIQLVTRTTNYMIFPAVLVEMGSGEIEWFDYKFVLKKQPSYVGQQFSTDR